MHEDTAAERTTTYTIDAIEIDARSEILTLGHGILGKRIEKTEDGLGLRTSISGSETRSTK